MTEAINPYAPPASVVDDSEDLQIPREIHFQIESEHQNYAERHFLLHQHSGGLTLLSVVAIFGGTATTVFLSMRGILPIIMGQAILAGLTSMVYLGIVAKSKLAARAKMRKYGVTAGIHCRLRIQPEDNLLVIHASGSEWTWPLSNTSLCGTLRGLIICPEPFLYLFLPKDTDFEVCSAKAFRRRLSHLIQQQRRIVDRDQKDQSNTR